LVLLAVLALRLPFLNQAIQGDDLYYLYGAEHAQIDPLHPNHASYAFQGRMVSMQGHPHPPLNAWFLGALLAILGEVREVPFHAAYILFSVIAALSALSIARRFSPYPLLATLLFLATPVFMVNGNSLESDGPFLAFWLLSIAMFVWAVDRRSLALLAASSVAMALAALAAYQAIVLVPILLLYGRKWRPAWAFAFTAPLILGIWQLYERYTSGALPATVLAGYMQSYGLQEFSQKLRNAVALTGHLGWLVCPILWVPGLVSVPFAIAAMFYDLNPLFWASIAVGIGILFWCARHWRDFLAQWILIFFGSALVLFFAGSARYLLPVALPLAILATQRRTPKWISAGIAGSAALGLCFAIVNYSHWDGYRQFARSLSPSERIWINADWGFRFYLERQGGLPLMEGQRVHAGETVVSSMLGGPMPFNAARASIAEATITSWITLRLVGLDAKSGFSSTAFGLRPFGISTGDIDRVRAERAIEGKPAVSVLAMNAPQAEQQIAGGVYSLEESRYRWMSAKANFLLKRPAPMAVAIVHLYIPDIAPARTVTISIDGQTVATQTYSAPGSYILTSAPAAIAGESATLTISVDKIFSVPGDQRQLGMILTQVELTAK
jgi:Dolichyl-phosphate-mannose-protein mannosyltransferase